MSTTIDLENAKQIRSSMEVYCGISAEDMSASVTLEVIDDGSIALMDANADDSLKVSSWDIVPVTDLAGGGFMLDAGVEFADLSHVGSDAGKYGVQSYTGNDLYIYVNASINSVSLNVKGNGTVRVGGGETYPLQEQLVVVVPAGTRTSLEFLNSEPDARMIVSTIVPGIVLNFNNDNLISVVLDLAGDLSLQDPSFEASSIEINAYYPNDISTIISTIAENSALWYYAGYDGNYCEMRRFYVTETASQEGNIINLRGEDASGAFSDIEAVSHVVWADNVVGGYETYTYIKSLLNEAGISLRHSQSWAKQTRPSSGNIAIIQQQSAQTFLGHVMLCCRTPDPSIYSPTYVDAGIPTLYHKRTASDGTYKSPYQLRVWEIREEDCAEVVRGGERYINAVKNETSGEPIICRVAPKETGTKTVLEEVNTNAGGMYNRTVQEYCTRLYVSNAKKIYVADADRISWVAQATGVSKIYGYPVAIYPVKTTDKYGGARPGVTIKVSPSIIGGVKSTSANVNNDLISNWMRFNGSNITGSFTWKGDPRMQPRDTFKFIRLNGTTEIATIERIEMTHEAGGTSAVIYYRLGVM